MSQLPSRFGGPKPAPLPDAQFTPEIYRFVIDGSPTPLMIECPSFLTLILFQLDLHKLPGAKLTSSPILWWQDEAHTIPAKRPHPFTVQRLNDTEVGITDRYFEPGEFYCTVTYTTLDENSVRRFNSYDPTICNTSLPPVIHGGPPGARA